jgi:hypothetical protein
MPYTTILFVEKQIINRSIFINFSEYRVIALSLCIAQFILKLTAKPKMGDIIST